MANDDPSYIKAYEDIEFLKSDELRPVRLLLELTKAEILQRNAGIRSTLVVFGSARLVAPSVARERLEGARREASLRPGDAATELALKVAERAVENSKYYDMAREFGRIVSATCQTDGLCDFVIVTGGGPGTMEAANRGAHDAGAKTIGLNIVLPREQDPNPFITYGLCFNFHYFAIRKMHFMLRAKALVAFPGGFGTLDELFEALTLVQTGKVQHLPVVLVGRKFWEKTINFNHLVDEGLIAPQDLRLFRFADSAEEAWRHVSDYYAAFGDE